MLELAVAAGILDIVQQKVLASEATRVRAVRVRVGELAGVVPDSLSFCFDAIVADTPWADAYLAIDRVPAMAACGECGCLTELTHQPYVCPACDSNGMTVQSGEGLQVVDIEVEDAVETRGLRLRA